MTGKWLKFQLVSLVIACVTMILTWRHGEPWSAQPYLVPFWIGFSPLLFYRSFKSARGEPTRRDHIQKLVVFLAGMVLVIVLNAGLAVTNFIDWPTAIPVIAVCAVLGAGGVVVFALRGRID
jgi:hypothetical protein